MIFEYVGIKRYDEDGKEVAVNVYQGLTAKHGDKVELNDMFSKKALGNADYTEVKARAKSAKNAEEPSLDLE